MSLSLNVGNFVTLKLTQSNYPLWREQLLALAESQDLNEHLTGPAPEKFTTPAASSDTTTTPSSTTISETYLAWRKKDRLLRGWIIGTLSEESLGLVVGLDSAKAVWDALQDEYAQDSQEREFTLRQQLVYLRKGEDKTLRDHIHAFKSLCDNLAAIGKPVNDKEKVFFLLTSLGPHYEHFATTMLKPPLPSYKDVVSQLQNLDQRRSWLSPNSGSPSPVLNPHLAFVAQQNQTGGHQCYTGRSNQGRNFTSDGRGFTAQNQSQQPTGNPNRSAQIEQNKSMGQRRPPPSGERRMTQNERDLYRNERCQYCGTQGHIAKICWWIPKKTETATTVLPQALAALTLDTSVADTEWMTDTGASNHMTGKSQLLSNFKTYHGKDGVLIGDGSSLKIKGIGETKVKQKHASIPLHDVLYVPALTKNLLSVSQLTSQYPVNCEFSNDLFYVKDRETGQTLMTGTRRGDLYVLPSTPELHFSHRQHSTTAEVWHQRLGHSQLSAVQLLNKIGAIAVQGSTTLSHVCDSCQLGKISRQPFLSSAKTSTKIFDKIHCDLWGPAPVLSVGQFRYYACLVDDFSRYTWLIPLHNKSDFFDAYINFEKYVHRQFNSCIKIFHSDGGGEFVNKRLSAHFQNSGIVHQFFCPHTPEQSGMVERRHRIIRELGMTMLFHSGTPLFLWVDAFMTAVYLINRLPCAALHNDSPYFKLHGQIPQYSMLRVFGSKCFPYTWDTKQHKFDPKSRLCVFIGYSETYKGYKCFDPTTRKVYVSRHVIFDETVFPYKCKTPTSLAAPQHHAIFDHWLLPMSDTAHPPPVQSPINIPIHPATVNTNTPTTNHDLLASSLPPSPPTPPFHDSNIPIQYHRRQATTPPPAQLTATAQPTATPPTPAQTTTTATAQPTVTPTPTSQPHRHPTCPSTTHRHPIPTPATSRTTTYTTPAATRTTQPHPTFATSSHHGDSLSPRHCQTQSTLCSYHHDHRYSPCTSHLPHSAAASRVACCHE
ncbi:hypothetical protein Dimus_038285 [Dionaea muscipula]